MESKKQLQPVTILQRMCFIVIIMAICLHTSYAESLTKENMTRSANGPVDLTDSYSATTVNTQGEDKSGNSGNVIPDSGNKMDKAAKDVTPPGTKNRPKRSVQTDPNHNHTDAARHKNQFDAAGMIAPSMTLGQEQSVLPPMHGDMEMYESPAEQRDDELEEMLERLHLLGYTHTVLPDNMSLYPDLMNYTEPAEGPEDEMEGPEGPEDEEHEAGEEFEAEDHLVLMTASVNGSNLVVASAEFEADEGLQPSGRNIHPMKVHSMSDMASKEYDPYYNYGYNYHPQKNEPHEQINPTPVLGRASRTRNDKMVYLPSRNISAGSHQKIMDKTEVKTKKKQADFSSMSASATFAIIVGSVIGFWMVVGPVICLVTRYRDKKKEKQKRFLLGPRQGQGQGEKGIMEAMIMTELGKLPFQKKKVISVPVITDPPSERQSLTEDREMDTYHDACDTPALLSGII